MTPVYESIPASQLEQMRKRIPVPAGSLLKRFAGKCFLAGGFCSSIAQSPVLSDINDVDLFFTDADTASAAAEALGKASCTSENALTFKISPHPAIQIITKWHFPTLESLLGSFDFTAVQAGLVYDESAGLTGLRHHRFQDDNDQQFLRYNTGTKLAANSLLRAFKFAKRGFDISPTELSEILADVHYELEGGASDRINPDYVRNFIKPGYTKKQ